MSRGIITDKEAMRDHILGLVAEFEARLEETYDCSIFDNSIDFHGSDEFYKEHLQSIIKHRYND